MIKLCLPLTWPPVLLVVEAGDTFNKSETLDFYNIGCNMTVIMHKLQT